MKQKKQAGMTLVELLCALAVLLLVSACMVLGVSLAVKSYERSVTHSEAQVLCATLQATVSDELRYSGTLYYREGRLVGFFSQDHGGEEAQDGFQADENGHIPTECGRRWTSPATMRRSASSPSPSPLRTAAAASWPRPPFRWRSSTPPTA